MTSTTSYETVRSHDGNTFEAFCALPERGSGPGILVFQEIFGINDNMRGLAERLAAEGFVALVPDMFWRIEPRFERKDESGLADAFAMVQKLDFDLAVADINSTHRHLLAMPECTGKVAAVGFCLGGTLAFAAATTSRVEGAGIDAAVPYYGSGINDLLDQAERLECPTMLHYGNNDPFIPEKKIAEVEAAAADKAHVTLHRYDAGHAFSNWDAPSMYDAEAAETAWQRTVAFLHAHLD
jgi:carboxymethylenebutenolidase